MKKRKTFSLISLVLLVSMLTIILASCKPETQPEEEDKNPPSSDESNEKEEEKEEEGEKEVLSKINIFMVGDSTMSSFADEYFYPRYGYGTQLQGYFDEAATVVNLALSGRSSKSFIAEANYTKLKNELKEGDYLIIGFGHNDEKSDDTERFTDASKPYTEEGSFGYSLNEYYIKLAIEKGATPILCTPIVRVSSSDNYSGTNGHVTDNGNYAQAIIDLGNALNVSVIDLTDITKARYEELGYDDAKYYHAFTAGKYGADGTTIVVDTNSLDGTHLNIYGAKYVAYRLATELKNLEGIGKYVLQDIAEPTRADLVSNPDYEVPGYSAPNLSAYDAPHHFKTVSEGWYGTAFGSTGGNPASSDNGYYATETEAGVFKVGQLKEGSNKGKFSSTEDGFAFAFRQVEADKNFTLSVTATVTTAPPTNQAGFGLMLRDDVYLSVNDKAIISNYVTAGILVNSSNTTAFFYRENTSLEKGREISTARPTVGDTYEMKIERIGQTVNITVIYNGEIYTSSSVDFDFFAVDNDYMYVGMFANRGTVIEFTNVQFEITGISQGA